LNLISTSKTAFTDVQEKHQSGRVASVIRGVATGLASRALGICVALLSVPLTITYLGTERYGIWVLLSSLLAWVRLADLGIGNGLTNAIANALSLGRRDLVRMHVSTALALLSTIALFLGLLIVGAWPWLNWADYMGVTSDLARAEVKPAVAISIGIFLLSFPLSIINVTYNATQQGGRANIWGMLGNVASLATLLAVTHTHGGLVLLVFAVSGVSFCINILSGLSLFIVMQPDLGPRLSAVRKAAVRDLLKVGVPFFLIQISALVVFQSDSMVIAHFLGADKVPVYSVTYNLFAYTTLLQTIAFNYTWVAYTDAISRRDISWLQRTFRFNMLFSVGTTAAAVIPLIFIASPFINIWTRGAIMPSFNLILWMAGWSLINAFCSPIASVLAAASHMRAQVVYSALAAALNIALSVSLVRTWGPTAVIASTVVSYLFLICIPASVDVFFLMRKLKRAL
jgi:O-antigen/teichoic acid export membrane protein